VFDVVTDAFDVADVADDADGLGDGVGPVGE
jgi:hypothetical protein